MIRTCRWSKPASYAKRVRARYARHACSERECPRSASAQCLHPRCVDQPGRLWELDAHHGEELGIRQECQKSFAYLPVYL